MPHNKLLINVRFTSVLTLYFCNHSMNTHHMAEEQGGLPQWSPKWGAHTLRGVQDNTLECRKKIFLYH